MKELGLYNYYDIFNNNRMFDPNFRSAFGDDLTYSSRYLAENAKKGGINVSTIDTQSLDSYDAIVFLDFPTSQNTYFEKLIEKKFENMYLFTLENELIRPDNWDKKNYSPFKKVFTWNDSFVDNKTTFKFFLPNKIPDQITFNIGKKTKFCCLIAGNKSTNHPLGLYSERLSAVRWFEKNAPRLFDLYGIGWNEYSFSGIFSPFNRFKLIKNLCSPKFQSYKGAINSKNEVLKNYKFSICYENARDIPGYITEKIFDCFFAGCIPIYWGAPNITDWIPENTFIDKREFKTYDELFDYLSNMTTAEYQTYIDAIKKFVCGPDIYQFSTDNFADLIINLV